MHFEVEQFNKKVITEPFNRAVLNKLVDYIDPAGKEKKNLSLQLLINTQILLFAY
ncbi:hypothetical protein BsIDN1_49560 [Bacillus safensis]|uniref:Uncharacterized protein n=1 Tax=Bacillus safensis TaxID=561879 RepID=A0A5S9MEB3_BACIA|nr:hypothetical protein BsIDN1_49560 [Bacillus safensis]